MRGSTGTRRVAARVPDRRSPSSGVCSDSACAFGARACDQCSRPSIGLVSPGAPGETFGQALRRGQETRAEQWNPDERAGVARPTFHQLCAAHTDSLLSLPGLPQLDARSNALTARLVEPGKIRWP